MNSSEYFAQKPYIKQSLSWRDKTNVSIDKMQPKINARRICCERKMLQIS